MAYDGVLDDIRRCISGGIPKRLPVFGCTEEVDVRLSGYRYEQFCADPQIMAKVMIEAVRHFDYDWAWLQIDDCFIVELLGVECRGGGDILRGTVGYLPAEPRTLWRLPTIDVRRDGRCPALLEAIRAIKKEFGETLCVVGHAEAPFSAAALLYGLDATLLKIVDDPNFLRETMKALTGIEIEFALAQLEAGADAIWLGDANASSHLISTDMYKQFAAGPCRQVAAAIEKAGGWTFSHNSEERPDGLAAQAACGPSVVSVGTGGDLVAARRAVGPKQCLMGNVDPILVLERGTPDDVEREVKRIIDTVSIHGAHMLSSGDMVPRETPAENLETMIRVAHEYWAERRSGRA